MTNVNHTTKMSILVMKNVTEYKRKNQLECIVINNTSAIQGLHLHNPSKNTVLTA